MLPEKPDFAPDFWRRFAQAARRNAELVEDDFIAETLLDIAQMYDEIAEHADRRQRKRA